MVATVNSGFLTSLQRRVLLYDGAMGTMLFAAGLQDGDPPEPWNWERPEVVERIYAAYYGAGADVVQTNTFGGTPIKLAEHGLEKRVHEANLKAARSLRAVCPEGRFVAGNIGPIGKFLQPMGEYTREQFEQAFTAQAQGLIEGGVDLISIETMYSLEEALAALRAVRRVGSLPVVVSMTFDRSPRGFFTLMGETVETCMRTLVDNGADVVGSNCSNGSNVFIDLAREIRAATDGPVIIQPNRGQPVLEGDGVVYRQSAEEFCADAATILALGINVIGGCCGTDPGFIGRIRPLLQSDRPAAARPEERA
jgi:5-methyltetrahydrofolate--homocysteine methyltransferase